MHWHGTIVLPGWIHQRKTACCLDAQYKRPEGQADGTMHRELPFASIWLTEFSQWEAHLRFPAPLLPLRRRAGDLARTRLSDW
jgi:hypothetical protein